MEFCARRIHEIAAVTLFFGPLSAHAALTQYEYQGNQFDFGSSTITNPCDPGVGGCQISEITATIVIEELAADLAFGSISPDSWSISDGLTTISDATPGYSFSFALSVGTNSSGDIDEWWFALLADSVTAAGDHSQIRTRNFSGTVDDQTDYCQTYSGSCTFTGIANVSSNPGTWTASVVPLPASAWLFGSALGLLSWVRIRRRSQAVQSG